MPIRKVKQNSDRGSIKDLAAGDLPANDPLSTAELRLQKLFNYSINNNDRALQSSLGIISVPNISKTNAMPIAVYHIRQIVDDIKSRSGAEINNLQQQFSEYITSEISPEDMKKLDKRAMIKTASKRKSPFPIFRRVS